MFLSFLRTQVRFLYLFILMSIELHKLVDSGNTAHIRELKIEYMSQACSDLRQNFPFWYGMGLDLFNLALRDAKERRIAS